MTNAKNAKDCKLRGHFNFIFNQQNLQTLGIGHNRLCDYVAFLEQRINKLEAMQLKQEADNDKTN